jgi:D-alanyl-D-alanine carboxypeptidase (penicillin-binding protein 5/6)
VHRRALRRRRPLALLRIVVLGTDGAVHTPAEALAFGAARMRFAAVPLLRSPRGRVITAVVLAATVLVAVVVTNQRPTGDGLALRGAVAAATTPAGGGAATPGPTPALRSGLRLLHARYHFSDESGQNPGAPALDAASGILIDPDSGAILWQQDAHVARPLASTAKILTAIVALENLAADQTVVVTADALHQAPDETRLGMQAGDQYTVAELLSAMLMISANDAASALAADTVGPVRFVAAMNEQLAALGLHDSHFTNSVGLDDPGELASPYDLGVLGLAAYDSFPLFRQIVGAHDLDVPPTSGHQGYRLHNINRLLAIYPAALGIKPGYTGDAGYCLVMLAARNGHRLIGVLMNDPHLSMDGRALLEWGFQRQGLPPLATPTPSPTFRPTPTPKLHH